MKAWNKHLLLLKAAKRAKYKARVAAIEASIDASLNSIRLSLSPLEYLKTRR